MVSHTVEAGWCTTHSTAVQPAISQLFASAPQLQTVEVVEEAVRGYKGVLLVVSHGGARLLIARFQKAATLSGRLPNQRTPS